MALITRFTRLFNADMHAVLDRIEEPEILLRQAVRDMQEELARSEQRQRWLRSELQTLDKKADAVGDVLQGLAEELDICFAENKEDLARSLIRRKLMEEQRRTSLLAQREAFAAESAELDTLLAARREQVEQMQQKVDVFCESAAGAGPVCQEPVITADQVEIAFLKERQSRSRS